jgi:hypothetical protein
MYVLEVYGKSVFWDATFRLAIVIDFSEKRLPLFSGYSDSTDIRIVISPSSLKSEGALLSELSIMIYQSCALKMQA